MWGNLIKLLRENVHNQNVIDACLIIHAEEESDGSDEHTTLVNEKGDVLIRITEHDRRTGEHYTSVIKDVDYIDLVVSLIEEGSVFSDENLIKLEKMIERSLLDDGVFVIASDVEYDNPLELDLHNLKLRLKLQLDMVERTKADIRAVEEMLGR